MKKPLSIVLLSLGGVALTLGGLCSIGAAIGPNRPVYHPAMAASDVYEMTFNSNNAPTVEYSPFEEKFTQTNFNNDNITFRYKRASNASGAFLVLHGGGDGGYIYNPWLSNSVNYNGIDGISDITVNFSSRLGELELSYGMSSDSYLASEKLTSGVKFMFDGYYPSHFRLTNKTAVGDKYDVKITSIVIHYHSYAFYEENVDFTEVMGAKSQTSIPVDSIVHYEPSSDRAYIGDNNYIRILYNSTENIKGLITYKVSNSTAVKEEYFYLEKEQHEFKMFLDAFRNSCKSKGTKTIVGISFLNVGHSNCTFTFYSLGVSSRVYYRTDTYYVGDDFIRLGVSMRYGGSINSVQNVSTASGYNIQEYVNEDYEIKIRSADVSNHINNVIKTQPNLVNIYDLGREVQQSYYIGVDSSNGYTRCKYNDAYVDYNPVQAGDQYCNEGQIVDYELTRDDNDNITSIWVKTMSCDWASNNILTKSYMENTYTVNDGLIYVNNRFVDWSGFSNYPFDDSVTPSFISNATATANGWGNRDTVMGYLGKQTAELPAFYVAHPLNYFAAVYDNKLIFDKNQGWNIGTTAIETINNGSLVEAGSYNGWTTYRSSLTKRSYHYSPRAHAEDWMGYFNEDYFGIGIYMPATYFNRDANYRNIFVSGNLYESHNCSEKTNRYYRDENYKVQTAKWSKGFLNIGKVDLTLESCYTDNTNYFTSILGFYPHEYVALDWTYVIGADYLNNLRTEFNALRNSNAVINDFRVWSGAEI